MTTTEITHVGHDRSADANTIIGWLRSSKTVTRDINEWKEYASEVAAAFRDDKNLRDLVIVHVLRDDSLFPALVHLHHVSDRDTALGGAVACCWYAWGYTQQAVDVAASALPDRLGALVLCAVAEGIPSQVWYEQITSAEFEQIILASPVVKA